MIALFSFDPQERLADVFDFAVRADAFEREDVITLGESIGRYDDHHAWARFALRQQARTFKDLFAIRRLQFHVVGWIVDVYEVQLECSLIGPRWNLERRWWADLCASDRFNR